MEAMASSQGTENSSRARKPNTKKSEKRSKASCMATAGSMWSSQRLSVQESGVREMQRGREDETVGEGVREKYEEGLCTSGRFRQ